MASLSYHIGFFEQRGCQSFDLAVRLPLRCLGSYPPVPLFLQLYAKLLLHLIVDNLLNQQAPRHVLLMLVHFGF